MGCHKCHDDKADEKTQRYHILIALMLSSQTKDQTNFAAMKRLQEHGLTPENIVKSDVNVLEKLINPVSFYKVFDKAAYDRIPFLPSLISFRPKPKIFKKLPKFLSMNILQTFRTP